MNGVNVVQCDRFGKHDKQMNQQIGRFCLSDYLYYRISFLQYSLMVQFAGDAPSSRGGKARAIPFALFLCYYTFIVSLYSYRACKLKVMYLKLMFLSYIYELQEAPARMIPRYTLILILSQSRIGIPRYTSVPTVFLIICFIEFYVIGLASCVQQD